MTRSAPAWALFADALLQRAALVARVGFDRLPAPLAGLRIDDADVARALAELPGARAGPPAEVQSIVAACAPALDAAREKLHADPFVAALAATAGLAPTEVEVLAVLVAVDVDPRRQRLVGYLNDDVTQRHLTPFTVAQLFADEADGAVAAVGPDGGLRRAALLDGDEAQPWARVPLRPARVVCWRLTGARALDPALPARHEIVAVDDIPPGDRAPAIVVLAGPDRVRRTEAAARALNAPRLLATPLPGSPAEWDAVVRHASVTGDAVLLDVADELPAEGRVRIERADHLRWAIGSRIDLPIATLPRRPWRAVVPLDPVASAAELKAAMGPQAERPGRLTAEQLHGLTIAAAALDGDVDVAVRRLAAGPIDRLATRSTPRRGWDDLVLRAGQLDRVREIVIRYRHRRQVFDEWGFAGRAASGVVALFAGESGTGKTLTAEIIAGELGQDLYTVDLSELVSKYIGETEKNLSAIFQAAEASPVVLFLDEADALLGKRSAVSDAHDRYANIEVAYLLQLLERHSGVALLATNLSNNIDKAFLRRIHVAVDFPMPDADERLRIWQRSLPSGVPLDHVRLAPVAERFELSGGSIRNAALTAAFLAADAGTGITPALLAEAVNRELRKLGRLARVDDLAELVPVAARESA